MSVRVKIPTPLRKFTDGAATVELSGGDVGEVLAALDAKHPGILDKICDKNGKVRRFINVYAGDDDIRFLDGLQTAVSDGTEISVIPAIAGG